jgi:hypothetical protein
MTEDEIEDCVERAERNWQTVTQGAPNATTKMGIFCCSDGPAAAAGGVGSFLWLSDREAMLTFIAETLPFSPGGPAGSDCLAVARDTSQITACLRSGQITDQEGLAELNKALRTFSQIKWIGTPEQLKTTDGGYPSEVRNAFFKQRGEQPAPRLIDGLCEDEFWEFLKTWGV